MEDRREKIIRELSGDNEKALRLGLTFNSQTRPQSEPRATHIDRNTSTALDMMALAGNELSEKEEALYHLMDSLNWSNDQVASYLKVRYAESKNEA